MEMQGPRPINQNIKNLESSKQNINEYFNTSNNTCYHILDNRTGLYKYLGKVTSNPVFAGREYTIRFEKDYYTDSYAWFYRIEETPCEGTNKVIGGKSIKTRKIRKLKKVRSKRVKRTYSKHSRYVRR